MSIPTLSLRQISLFTIGFFSLSGLVSAANAAIVNGNFSSGLNNWDRDGDVSIFSGQALLTTASSVNEDDSPIAGTPFNFSGDDVTDIAGLETFLGVDPFALDPTNSYFGAFEGSAIKQTFTAQPTDSISFDWKFLTNEDRNSGFASNDTAFVTLVNNTDNTAQVMKLADINNSLTPSSSSLGFDNESQTNNFGQALSPGEYTLGLTVVDDTDSTISSALQVDNVEIVGDGDPRPTPEPTTILAFLTTVVAGSFVRIKKH
jgi:hypothetical protein